LRRIAAIVVVSAALLWAWRRQAARVRRARERAEFARKRRLWSERQSMFLAQDDAVARLLADWDEKYGPDGYRALPDVWDSGYVENAWLLGEHYEP